MAMVMGMGWLSSDTLILVPFFFIPFFLLHISDFGLGLEEGKGVRL